MATASHRGNTRGSLTRLLDIAFENCGCDLERGSQRSHYHHDCEPFWGLVFGALYTAITMLVVVIFLTVGSSSS